ncbi:serine hydrolase domain-containing protein [Parvibaculum sp.]|uniref:serine hydrolase domain-containing protein n=1 Tax=Parvibaculum sp. TaxID=2024848 RepID=UPI001DD69308|nr:serine hydrolase domain-containing protein [Parvibaculum sp.]MBX3490584.1 beta-lactamase family protein [Parvibaculum sp.]MCW5728442.1 beta-lactamase family protein [Parvibaculum sp.]
MPLSPARLQDLLDTLTRQCGVPGASLAVWAGDTLAEAATGVCNLETQVPVTPQTLFQIGSITKLYTSTLCLQLVEEGKLALDVPVRATLPDFRVKDEAVAAEVTLRDLLAHRSGIEGDYFKDAGRGEDRVEKFVGLMAALGQVHGRGEMFSYCNTGFVAAGRMIEVADGRIWDKAVRARIAKPLATPAFSTLPEQAMRYRTAIGHLGQPGKLFVTPIVYLAQSNAPVGSTPMAMARDVVAFARMLMAGGAAADGTRLLSPESVAAMQTANIVCPRRMNIDAIGLAAFMWDWDGDGKYEVFGHDGSTIGQAAWLRYHPASRTAFCLLTNGGNGKAMADSLIREVFTEAAGIAPPELPPVDEAFIADPARYEGRYANTMETIEVTVEEGRLVATSHPAPDYAVIAGGAKRVPLQAVDAELFLGTAPGMTLPQTYHFLGSDTADRARWLHQGARAHKRV